MIEHFVAGIFLGMLVMLGLMAYASGHKTTRLFNGGFECEEHPSDKL